MAVDTKRVKEAVVLADKCKGCGNCIDACPNGLMKFSESFNIKGYHPAEFVDPNYKCTACGFCYMMCPDCAIEVYVYK